VATAVGKAGPATAVSRPGGLRRLLALVARWRSFTEEPRRRSAAARDGGGLSAARRRDSRRWSMAVCRSRYTKGQGGCAVRRSGREGSGDCDQLAVEPRRPGAVGIVGPPVVGRAVVPLTSSLPAARRRAVSRPLPATRWCRSQAWRRESRWVAAAARNEVGWLLARHP